MDGPALLLHTYPRTLVTYLLVRLAANPIILVSTTCGVTTTAGVVRSPASHRAQAAPRSDWEPKFGHRAPGDRRRHLIKTSPQVSHFSHPPAPSLSTSPLIEVCAVSAVSLVACSPSSPEGLFRPFRY